MKIRRCDWANHSEIEKIYHDTKWGKPVHDEKQLFKMLILEGKQAGLSWRTILNKMETISQAFDDFNPEKIIRYDQKKIDELMINPGVIKNKLKIRAVIQNAKMYHNLCQQHGSLDSFLWSYVNNEPIINQWETIQEVPSTSPISHLISKELKKQGFQFVGSTVIYALMQSIGMVNDHLIHCSFKYQ